MSEPVRAIRDTAPTDSLFEPVATSNEVLPFPKPQPKTSDDHLIRLMYESTASDGDWKAMLLALVGRLHEAEAACAPGDPQQKIPVGTYFDTLLDTHLGNAEKLADSSWQDEDIQLRLLEMLPLPAVVIDEDLTVVRSNRAFAGLLQEEPAIDATLKGLATRSTRRAQDLRNAVRKALTAGSGEPCVLPLPDSELSAYITRLDASPPTAMLMFPHQAQTPDVDEHVLRHLFELTPAEARLTRGLSAGHGLKDACVRLFVSHNTGKAQLKSAFAKLGVHTQAELVAKVLSCGATLPALRAHAQHQHDRHHLMRLADGRQLSYQEYGDPRGFPTFFWNLAALCRLLPDSVDAAAMKLGIRLISVERPGIGYSDPCDDLTPDRVADDLIELSAHLRLSAYSLIAHSIAAPGALALGAKNPDALQKLVLVSPAMRINTPNEVRMLERHKRFLFRLTEFLPALRRRILRLLAPKFIADPEAFYTRYLSGLPARDKAAFALPAIKQMFAEGVVQVLRQGIVGMDAEMCRLVRPWGFDYTDVKRPVIAWQGSADVMVRPEWAHHIASSLPDCELHMLEGEGNLFFYVRPEDVLPSVLP